MHLIDFGIIFGIPRKNTTKRLKTNEDGMRSFSSIQFAIKGFQTA